MRYVKNNKTVGFTLVELSIVLVIIGVLAVVVAYRIDIVG
jgi:prepilin-type N-terminal cleavage/methylation domain-containing protein